MVEYREARYPQIWYGDGHWVELRRMIEYQNEDGIWGWLMIINPSREMIDEYNLKPGTDLDQLGFVRRWYPKSVVKRLRDDPVTGRVFVKTDFNGIDTSSSREVAEYVETINDQQRIIKSLKAGKARLAKELDLATSQAKQYWIDQAGVIEAIKKMTGGSDEGYPGDEAPGG